MTGISHNLIAACLCSDNTVKNDHASYSMKTGLSYNLKFMLWQHGLCFVTALYAPAARSMFCDSIMCSGNTVYVLVL